MIAALFVITNGPYFGLPNVDPWNEKRDARDYRGPHRVIAHPPCERWGRYATGGPSAKVKRKVGDDAGCFESALKSVRKYGGVLEHPEASKAFKHFGLRVPDWHGGWSRPDSYGGMVCCVAQGHYGHAARKMTWLYAVNCRPIELKWGPAAGTLRLDEGFHSKEERRRAVKTGVCQRLSQRQRKLTPIPFRDLLIKMVSA
jgi:hypothetical protein